MCRAALRGCGRRCRRRLSGILPSRGAKAELRFWRALSAANMRTIAHTLLLLVVLLQFGAVIPPVCATREREEQGPLQEGDARERRRKSQRSGKWSGSGRARKSEERRHRRAYRRQVAVTEVISSNRAACFASDGRQGPWLPGTKPGPGGQERVENSGNELLVLRAGAG